jgi:lysophospholipase L1-like esterase
VLALGDSLTRGAGDSAGKGYAGYMVDELKGKTEQEVILSNLGVNGLRANQLVTQLAELEIQTQVKRAEIILVSIGGNDLFQGGQTLLNVTLAKDLEIEFAKQLQIIVSELRALNETAVIYLIGLYNPFIEMRDPEITSKIVRDWNFQAAEIAAQHPQTIMVPTFDIFQMNVQEYLHTDQFHPNTEGYRLIGERVAALIMLKTD